MRALLACLALCIVACRPIKPAKNVRVDQGTRVARTWCDPSRALPADPALGLARPLRFGVGSIVHERDSTSETFLAASALGELLRVPERQVEVVVVDHPSDADYSIMGALKGDVRYARETKMGGVGWGGYAMAMSGYLVGGTIVGTTLLIDAISPNNGAVPTLRTIGLLGLGVGIAGHVMLGSRPANRYSWDHTASLTLRRGPVVIGEFEIKDVHDKVQWGARAEPRKDATRALWLQAATEITACITQDLNASLAGPVAEAK